MSKIVFLCTNNARFGDLVRRNLQTLSARIMPDNITPRKPILFDERGIVYTIFNPSDCVLTKNGSVCLGGVFEKTSAWWDPFTKQPDGSYALFRSNSKYVEVLSDVVATRTIWYFMNDEVFISSTSQRAIVSLLKAFRLNRHVITWMLSTGTLGMANAWDERIKCLEGDSSLVLDREAWNLTRENKFIEFSVVTRPDRDHQALLEQTLRNIFDSIDLDYSRWVLPLSGGFDSRGILCLLKNISGLRTLSWGLGRSLHESSNDAYVARRVAESMGVSHEYFVTDRSDEPTEFILRRFLVCGEGRIDHIPAYMDGFEIWKTLFQDGIHGIIRGDEGFGWAPVTSPSDVRRAVGLPLYSDFVNLRTLDTFGLPDQQMPDGLLRIEGESLESWRDRLYHQFRIPVILAALNDLKCAYLEVVNPLLSRRIIYQVRELPDHLRTDKVVYKKFVRSIGPKIGFAKYPAIDSPENVLKTEQIVGCIRDELSSDHARCVLSPEFVAYVMDNIDTVTNDSRRVRRPLRARIRAYAPRWLVAVAKRARMKQKMDFNVLAFRAYIVSRMTRMLAEDARSLN